MPYVPGKTVKGLFREAVDNYCQWSNAIYDTNASFGWLVKHENDTVPRKEGTLFFSNATLFSEEYQTIVSHHAQSFLFRHVASTKIDEEGITKEHSLRQIEVTVPCALKGIIMGAEDSQTLELLQKGARLIKRMGLNRNRGLGRCKFTVKEKEAEK
jgi:CRISPR/Cas system CSM-associated protein Csm3 (group 7 of RAMP superfamily)